MDIRFDGKRALVTGVGKGIGRGIAVKLAQCGAEVVGISRTQADLDSLQKEVAGIVTYNVDVADWDATRKVVEGVGHIDLLVNNAGVTNWTPFLDVTKEEFENVFDINYKAVYNISQVIARGMVARGKGGAIVNMSSVGGLTAFPNHTLYCSAKGALDQLTRTLALELGPHQIRVNSVNPTVVLTELGRRGWGDDDKVAKVTSKIPLGRLAEVEHIVDATLFLLSDRSSMTSGIVMPIDGGMTSSI